VEEYGTPAQRAAFFLSLAGANLKRDRYVVSEDTLRYARIALEAYRETGNLIKIAWAQYNLGFYHLLLGNLDEAEQLMQAALAIAERTGDVTVQSYCWTYLTIGRRIRGQVEKTPLVYPFYLAALFPLIAVALARHQIVEAVSHARALLAPEQRRLPAALTAALQTAIQVWEAGQPETARAHLEQALALAQEIGYL